MKKEQITILHTCSLMLLCIGLNYGGKLFVATCNIPLWLDSIGTALATCLLGTFFGLICGLTNNILYGLQDVTSFAYSLTSCAIALVIGQCLKKGMLKDRFGIFSASALVALASACVSTPLNLLFFSGRCGNVWGDAVLDMLTYYHFPTILASALGELLVDFPDKVLTMCILYGVLQFTHNPKHLHIRKAAVILLFSLSLSGVIANAGSSQAAIRDKYASSYSQTVYNSSNGLVGGEANTIVETKDGYLWIGTYSGLYRYDGSTFHQMSDMPSVKNVNCLFEDEEGRLWIGTNDKGISIYVKDKISNILSEDNGLLSNSIRCIAEDTQGYYYVGTSDALCIVSINNGLRVIKTIPEITYARSISASKNGDVAIVTNSGNLFILNDTKIQSSYTLQSDNAEAFYTCCTFTDQDELWVGTTLNETLLFEKNDGNYRIKKHYKTGDLQNINSINQDENNNYWLCAENGISYFEEESFHTLDTNSFNSSIDNMTTDYQGNLWFTSSRLGLLKLSKTCFTNLYRQYNLKDSVVNSVTKWQASLYIGTDEGLQIIDESTQKIRENDLTKKLSGKRIRCLKVDSMNHLWIAISGDEGLLEITPDGKITEYNPRNGTISNRFRTITELKNGVMAATENTGIDFIQNQKVIATIGENEGLENPQILCLMEQEDGTLLAGSDGCGIVYIQDYKVKKTINTYDGLSSNVILRIVALSEGYLVVTSNGLCYLDENLKCRQLSNFPYSNNFDAISTGDGNIWVLGSAGIYIASEKDLLADEKDYTLELLDEKRGLESSITANAWNHLDGEGNYYISCSSGVYQVNINQYNDNKTIYRMWLNNIVVDGTSYAVNKSEVTTIKGSAEKLEISPVLMNYTRENPSICYTLEGFESKKNIVKQSDLGTIVYTNLPSGTYTFVISILDYTGKEIESSSYRIEKPRRFWENWWFIAYCILICLLIVIYLTWLMTRLQSNRVIERQNREIAIARKQAEMGNETILTIAKTVDAKDENTSQHSERVAEYSVLIAKRLGWDEARCENLEKIARLHDIGKIGIPDAVLNKPSRLTDEEYEIIKQHVKIGADILKDFSLVEDVAEGARYHHERYDGRGYAEGLAGEDIPINARIIGIADAFDAMTSNRVYRDKMDMDYVMNELHKGSGTQFDPKLTKIMITLIEEGIIDPKKKHND